MAQRQSNYELMRDKMRLEFLNYDQNKMISKFDLRHDENYLYINFLSYPYRICRKSGTVEWSSDGFVTSFVGDYNESMTIYDVLCCSADDCHLSGRFCPVHELAGASHGGDTGTGLFTDAASLFDAHTDEFIKSCKSLGGIDYSVGDASFILPVFDFLPVILQFWKSDEEFPSSLKLMWDENILDYMHFETTFFATFRLMERISEKINLI